MTENEKKLLQAKHRLEEAEMRDRQKERKARTRRLVQEGAILEKALPQTTQMTLEQLEDTQTARPYGTPWKKPSVERTPNLHTALTLPCRMNFPLRKTSLLQGDFYWRTL